MPTIPADALIVRRDDVVANDLSATELVMLDLERGTYFGLKEVGKIIWSALESPITVDALCDRLVEKFDVDEATCRRDVTTFLEQLQARELIDVLGGETSR